MRKIGKSPCLLEPYLGMENRIMFHCTHFALFKMPHKPCLTSLAHYNNWLFEIGIDNGNVSELLQNICIISYFA